MQIDPTTTESKIAESKSQDAAVKDAGVNGAAPIQISRAEKGGRGRYWTDTAAGEAELIYTVNDASRMVIGSTFVPRGARGGGIALALVKRAINDARTSGRKIGSNCPYVDRLFDRHPEWRDLRI